MNTTSGLASHNRIKHHVWDRGHFLTRLMYFYMMRSVDQKRSRRLVQLVIYTRETAVLLSESRTVCNVNVAYTLFAFECCLCKICQRLQTTIASGTACACTNSGATGSSDTCGHSRN